jgi:hypothetical protein
MDKAEAFKIENMLNWEGEVGKTPMKYLGFLIRDSRLGLNAFNNIIEKMKRIGGVGQFFNFNLF